MKNIICLVFLMTFALSCDFLERESKDFEVPENFFNSEEDFVLALNGIYATLAEGALFGDNMLGRMGLSADIGYEYYASDYNTVGNYNASPSDIKITNYWRRLYDGINRANILIDNIARLTVDEKRKNDIYGQALFLRAYFYFLLVVRFDNIPLILTPVYSSDVSAVQVSQSSNRTVYQQIVKDMEEAAVLVEEASDVESPGRVSQSVVYGMLSRVCLYMAGYPVYEKGMYEKGRQYAQKVIDSNFHSLNPSYQQIFLNYIQDKYDMKESIFEVEFYGIDDGIYKTAGRVGRNNGIACTVREPIDGGLSVVDMYGYSLGTIRATQYYYSLFEEGDLRRNWTIAPYTYNNKTGEKVDAGTNYWIRFCGKFRRENELASNRSIYYTSTNFPLLRYAEVLLNWAEFVASDENSSQEQVIQANEYVNQIRRRAYGFDITQSGSIADIIAEDRTALLDIIKEERARELGFELLRKDDIVRWGEFSDRMKYVQTIINKVSSNGAYYGAAKAYYNSFGKRDEFWPIPSYEIGVNRKLKQNIGW